jgi:hypothetical protein
MVIRTLADSLSLALRCFAVALSSRVFALAYFCPLAEGFSSSDDVSPLGEIRQ